MNPVDAIHAFLVFVGEMVMFWMDFLREAVEALLGDFDPLES